MARPVFCILPFWVIVGPIRRGPLPGATSFVNVRTVCISLRDSKRRFQFGPTGYLVFPGTINSWGLRQTQHIIRDVAPL